MWKSLFGSRVEWPHAVLHRSKRTCNAMLQAVKKNGKKRRLYVHAKGEGEYNLYFRLKTFLVTVS